MKVLIKIDKPLEKNKKTNYQYQGEKEAITIGPVDIERIVRPHYETCITIGLVPHDTRQRE